MARTKQTARQEGLGPNIASKAVSRKERRKQGKPMHIFKHPRKRRLNRTIHMFNEIRKSQKCVELCTPKLAFQRLVREICEAFSQPHKRWKVCTLLAVQEAAENFIMEYFNDLTIVAFHAHQITVMDKDSNIVKRMRWRYDKLLQHSNFVDKKMRDLLVIPLTKKEEADALKIRDIAHVVQTRVKAAYTELVSQREMHMKQSQALTEDDEYINETRRLNSRNVNLLRGYLDRVYMYLNMGDGERCLALITPDIEILRNPKAELSDTIFYAGIKACIISNILEVSQAKTVENAPLFLDIGDIELMLAFGEVGVSEEVAPKEKEEHGGTIDAANLDALAVAEDVSINQMEELGATRVKAAIGVSPVAEDVNQMEELGATKVEATIGVLPVADDVPAQTKGEKNMDALAVALEVPSNIIEEIGGKREQPEGEIPGMTDNVATTNTMEELGDTREKPEVDIPPMTDDVAATKPADRMEEVGGTREEQELGVPHMTEHMAEDKSADDEHPVDSTVQEEPAHSNREEEASKKEEPKHNTEDDEDQQSIVKDSALDKSP
ncbi:hypothetical protein L7F22_048004 [Adiantum nelumboides]|nr:hypothetical protein [Adiantum nelumboides]